MVFQLFFERDRAKNSQLKKREKSVRGVVISDVTHKSNL